MPARLEGTLARFSPLSVPPYIFGNLPYFLHVLYLFDGFCGIDTPVLFPCFQDHPDGQIVAGQLAGPLSDGSAAMRPSMRHSGTASSFKLPGSPVYIPRARKGRPKELVVHFNSFHMNDFLALLKFPARFEDDARDDVELEAGWPDEGNFISYSPFP